MEDVGYVAESSDLLDYFRFLDANLLTEDDMREGVRLAIARSFTNPQERTTQKYSNPSQITLGVRAHIPISDPTRRIGSYGSETADFLYTVPLNPLHRVYLRETKVSGHSSIS
jgi:hypothetical protein